MWFQLTVTKDVKFEITAWLKPNSFELTRLIKWYLYRSELSK